MFRDSQYSTKKEGRERGTDLQENPSVSMRVLAAENNEPPVNRVPSASDVERREAGFGVDQVPFPAPGNLCPCAVLVNATWTFSAHRKGDTSP